MRHIYSIGALALTAMLAACSSDNDESGFYNDPNAVCVNATVSSALTTRSNPADATKETVFNDGDQIAISNDGGTSEVVYTKSDGAWGAGANYLTWGSISWQKAKTGSGMTFTAYYPANETSTVTGNSFASGSILLDQSAANGSGLAKSDYMTCKTSEYLTATDDRSITLDMERKIALVKVAISGFNDQYDATTSAVSDVKIYSQYQSTQKTGDAVAITPYTTSDGKAGSEYYAVVVPGDGATAQTFVTLKVGTDELTVEGLPKHEAGYKYTYNLTVGKNGIKIGTVSIEDWTGSTSISSGEAEKVVAPTADASTHTITFKTAGTLADNTSVIATVLANGNTELKLAGKVNASDILALRDYCLDTNNSVTLETLDLSGTTITALPANALSVQPGAVVQSVESLKKVVLPSSCTTIGQKAFDYCTELAEINLENVTSIGQMAFLSTALTSVDLSSATTIGYQAFRETKLTEFIAPKLTELQRSVFQYCTLSKVELESCTSCESYAFGHVTISSGGTVKLPACTSFGSDMFYKTSATGATFYLTASGDFDMNANMFNVNSFTTNGSSYAPALVLNVDKKTSGIGSPKVLSDDTSNTSWGFTDTDKTTYYSGWASITFQE